MIINLLIVWFLTGLWHGASVNFILWGLYFGVILIIEKLFLMKYLQKLPAALQHIYSLFLIVIGWVIFYFEDMQAMGQFFIDLFNPAGGVIGQEALVLVWSYLPLLAAAVLASTPLAYKLYEKIKYRNWCWIPETTLCAVALLICTATLVSQSYNPFIYFRF